MPRLSASTQEETPRLRFVARQPIFDVHNHIHGYELLYREGPENRFSGNGDHASRIMLDNTLLFGLNELTGKSMAFVNCTREILVEKLVTLLPPQSTVLEVLENIEPDPEVIQACGELRKMGYRIALDDFVLRPGLEPFKIDFMLSPAEERKSIRNSISNRNIHFLAEKVETLEDFQTALHEGYEYFQGYYFCRPALMSTGEIPPNRLNYLALLRALHHDPLDLREIEPLVKREASLCYRLLRLVNSALFGLRQEVTSITTALITIGDQQFRKLASISIAAELNGRQTAELLVLALARARFCELSAKIADEDPTEQYLLGLFSLFPAILRMKMEDILPSLPFRSEIQSALKGEANPERRLLGCLEQYEQASWPACAEYCSALGVSESQVAENYTQAVRWAEDALAMS